MSDSDLIRRGDVRKAFADFSSVLDDFNEELDKVPADPVAAAALALADSIRDSQTTIGGGIVAEIDEDAFNAYRAALAERNPVPPSA